VIGGSALLCERKGSDPSLESAGPGSGLKKSRSTFEAALAIPGRKAEKAQQEWTPSSPPSRVPMPGSRLRHQKTLKPKAP
jgi:hypothetical protein